MRKLAEEIKNILSRRWATFLIIAIAIISRVLHFIFFFNIRVDRSYQLLATQNFVHGDGISTASVLPADLSTIIYTPLIKWPPGYSLLLAPLYSVTGNDYLLSSLLLDIIFGILLIFISRAVLRLLNLPLYLINLYTIVSSLFIYYFYFITSSDGIASTLFIVALYFTLLFLKGKLSRAKAILTISFFLFACAFMKYLFMPAVFVIPLFLVWKGASTKQRSFLRGGLSIAFLLSVGLAATLLYQKSISGAAAYVSDAERGFFAENLFSVYPLIPGAIIKPETASLLLASPKAEQQVSGVFRILYLIFILIALYYTGRKLIRSKFKSKNLDDDFFYLSAGICIATTVLLAFLSLRVAKAEDMPGNWWTFIQEPRYYGLPNVLIHLSVFVFYLVYKERRTKTTSAIFFILLFSLLPELLRGTLFTAKRVVNLGKEEYSWQADWKMQRYVDSILRKEKANTATDKVVLAGSSYYFNNRISLYSHVPILETNSIREQPVTLQTKEPVLLLSVVNNEDSAFFKKFTTIEKPVPLGRFYDFSVYINKILPGNTK